MDTSTCNMPVTFKIPVKPSELQICITLQCGQSFRWFEITPNHWAGVIKDKVWILHQNSNDLFCAVIGNERRNKKEAIYSQNLFSKMMKNSVDGIEGLNKKQRSETFRNIIHKYFRLEESLEELYRQWSCDDDNFKCKSKTIFGVRLLDQDAVENVFSFICSSNNNIQRITSLVDQLCQEYGTYIAEVDGKKMYSFPDVKSLAQPGTNERLRELGFGYRASYIQKAAEMIMVKGGENWLRELKNLEYRKCFSELTKLSGIGPKVADCICLMSMDNLEAIPVDTHIFQVAARDYLPHLNHKTSLTPKVYEEIGEHFRELFGGYAGWAHTVLFSADLKKFKIGKNQEKQQRKRKRS